MTAINWPVVLQVQGKPVDAQIIEHQYRLLARKRHPDAGGSNDAMTELNLAKESALKWVAEQALIARQAEAARIAAKQAEAVFHQAYQQQMNAQHYSNVEQWNSMLGGLGGMAQAANAFHAARDISPTEQNEPAEIKEEKFRTKWQRVRDILRGKA